MKKIKIIALMVFSLVFIAVLTTVVINKVLESQWERKTESQYELIRKTVDENSEYYTEFSKEFIRVVKIKADVENITYRKTFQFHKVENEMNIPINDKLNGIWEAVFCEPIDGDNVWYAYISSPYHVGIFEYWLGYSHTYLVKYAIIYIPDEYITETNLKAILDDYQTLLFRKDNLFVVGNIDNRA
jgi:hypothetical protein